MIPGYIMSIHFDPRQGLYYLMLDMPKFDKSLVWKRPGMMETYLTSIYYVMTSVNADFDAVRQGSISNVECQGYHIGLNMMDQITFRKAMIEVISMYPCHAAANRFYHSPMLFNIMLSLVRRFTPARLRSKFELGCQFPGGRLDSVYMVGDPEKAKEHLIARVSAILRRRYDNEKSFSLSSNNS
ncbi:expressed unknown protein [Seminavis robusta]|uniref:CRAL-TRIO domain-containing protein n=1 Tax=Seminavis robusta TaxID=568900 RepID=A0A9N8DGB8_9STRA|nr:expressed unknown protein [Seminavis robusta]|eukprot:Sro128_g061260.1 n/a (184) ;mRNA; f:66239-66790